MSQLDFYYHPFTRARIVQWMLEELEVPYETHFMDIFRGEHKRPEFLAINPMGKIPTVVHTTANGRRVVVTESAAICAYLADAFPEAKLAPAPDDPARGAYYRWLFFAAGSVEYALLDRASPRVTALDPTRVGYGTYESTVATLEEAVGQGFLTGTFSAADVYVATAIGWGLHAGNLEARPAFAQYLELCHARPGYQRATAKANADAAKVKRPG